MARLIGPGSSSGTCGEAGLVIDIALDAKLAWVLLRWRGPGIKVSNAKDSGCLRADVEATGDEDIEPNR